MRLILIIVGVCLLVWGGVELALDASFVNRMVAAEGTVLEVVYRPPQAEYDVGDYRTKVEFRTSEGQLVRFEQPFSETQVGDKVRVLYDPSNPSEVRIYGAYQFWMWWTGVMVVGGVMFIVGLRGWLSEQS